MSIETKTFDLRVRERNVDLADRIQTLLLSKERWVVQWRWNIIMMPQYPFQTWNSKCFLRNWIAEIIVCCVKFLRITMKWEVFFVNDFLKMVKISQYYRQLEKIILFREFLKFLFGGKKWPREWRWWVRFLKNHDFLPAWQQYLHGLQECLHEIFPNSRHLGE